MTFDFETLQQLSCGAERIDTACPICGPHCRAGSNRTRKVLRIFNQPGFSTYNCARCGEKGYAHERGRRSNNSKDPIEEIVGTLNPTVVVPDKQPDQDAEKEAKSALARRLWRRRLPIRGTIAETYLRDVRGYRGPLPDTFGFSPANGKYKPSMIAAFGLAKEPEPGALEIDPGTISGIHMTRLLPDGSGKDFGEDNKAKIMLGPSAGQPIVLAPCNDLLALVIAEGIEDALTAHAITGRGAWAAGSASRLPKLADVVPSYVECVTVLVDDDDAGNNNAKQLVTKLIARGFEVRVEAGGTS
jgi:Toprim domain